ncbi:MAG: hypothetical protein QW517_09005 [Thermofilaceae archaeon]
MHRLSRSVHYPESWWRTSIPRRFAIAFFLRASSRSSVANTVAPIVRQDTRWSRSSVLSLSSLEYKSAVRITLLKSIEAR